MVLGDTVWPRLVALLWLLWIVRLSGNGQERSGRGENGQVGKLPQHNSSGFPWSHVCTPTLSFSRVRLAAGGTHSAADRSLLQPRTGCQALFLPMAYIWPLSVAELISLFTHTIRKVGRGAQSSEAAFSFRKGCWLQEEKHRMSGAGAPVQCSPK